MFVLGVLCGVVPTLVWAAYEYHRMEARYRQLLAKEKQATKLWMEESRQNLLMATSLLRVNDADQDSDKARASNH